MKPSVFIALLLGSMTVAFAQPRDRMQTDDLRKLMTSAIEAGNGQSHGILTGEMVDVISRHFQATSPIYIDISTERRYAQAGCSRLKVVFRQEGIQLPGQPVPKTETVEMGINYCRDGQPPRSLD